MLVESFSDIYEYVISEDEWTDTGLRLLEDKWAGLNCVVINRKM